MKDKVRELFVLLFSQIRDERFRWKLFSKPVGRKAIFKESIVETLNHYKSRRFPFSSNNQVAILMLSPVLPGRDSCSVILLVSDPLTTPMASFLRSCCSTSNISGVARCDEI